jgi:hypothetical protein
MATAPAPLGPVGLKPDSKWSRLALHKVPATYLLLTSFASYLITALGWLGGWPAWLTFGVALAPWFLILFFEVEWAYKHFHWFVVFFVMAIIQAIHYSEHCIEVIQVHIFGTPTHEALAIFSKLNVEGVHFGGDTMLTIGTLFLLTKFPRNPWLWVAIPFQVAHQAEHTYLFWQHVVNGYPGGGPGLLASPGGAIGNGIGLNRPDLHWIYNTLFTIPFCLALYHQLKRTYDESLDIAFHGASKEELIEVQRHLETFQYEPGETVLAPGDPAHRMYIVTDGEADVLVERDGQEVLVEQISRGKYFGESGILMPDALHSHIVRARTHLTVLAMDEATFRHLMASSQEVKSAVEAEARAEVSAPLPNPAT